MNDLVLECREALAIIVKIKRLGIPGMSPRGLNDDKLIDNVF